MKSHRFAGILLDGHKGAAVEVPFSPEEQWGIPAAPIRKGRRGHIVEARVNGVTFTSAIVPRSKTFWLEIENGVMNEAGVEPGDRVTIVLKSPG